jgi:hypothetical protein
MNTVTYRTYLGNKKGTIDAPAYFADAHIKRYVSIKEDGTIIQVINTSLPDRYPYRSITVQNLADTTFELDYMRPIDEQEFNTAYDGCLQDIDKERCLRNCITDDTLTGS